MLSFSVLCQTNKQTNEEKKKRKKVQVLFRVNMEEYLLHISEKNVWLINKSSDQGLWNIDEKIIFYQFMQIYITHWGKT